MCDVAFVRCTERLECLWGKYSGIVEHNMVGSCRGEEAQPSAVFNKVIEKIYKECFYEISGVWLYYYAIIRRSLRT